MDWIERVLHLSPDGGSGSLETGIVAAAAIALAMVIAGAVKLGPVVKRRFALRAPRPCEGEPAPLA